ncbi:hypothetical protein [Tenacibaculum retecalamus]|uniref:hypothetical protein n=1 Tax=Tenacibaculum retecalamus TaxID=3018315 RepID=UPI0023D9491D|nr:hypothetical protein [Tenacibaculum retecalamus]WBX71449.1 hypothetical protein PG912_01220 [Tenacibaculum retecalamus]
MKVKIALFFFILFTSMIVAPTIITLIDQDQDISIFLNLTEEEEENQAKKNTKEIKIYSTTNSDIFFTKNQKIKNVIYLSKNYVSEFLKITTPPPEFAI